jgi:hypothetical protein
MFLIITSDSSTKIQLFITHYSTSKLAYSLFNVVGEKRLNGEWMEQQHSRKKYCHQDTKAQSSTKHFQQPRTADVVCFHQHRIIWLNLL